MSLITPDFGLVFWMTLIFAIVFFIVAKFGFPVITGMADKRSDYIEESLAKAREAQKFVAEIEQKQEQMLREADMQQARLLKEAAQTRDAIIAKAHEQAADEASRIMEQAREQIQAERDSAVQQLRSEVAELSISVAEKLLRTTLDNPEAQKELSERIISESGNLNE